MEKEQFFILLDKYLSNETNSEEDKLLISYYESFQNSTQWDEVLGSKDEVKGRMLKRLQNVLEAEEVKVIPIKRFYSTNIFKYGVAASMVALISISLLLNKNNALNEPQKTVVAENNIMIGSNKATLTLGNGTIIKLEKGKNYTSGNVKSNGEELVYDSNANSESEIASNYLTIPRGGQFFLKLADGTKVWLNSETQLKFPVAFVDGETRQIELLYGEAYFEVSPSTQHKGSRFKVKTQEQNIEVIGTEFNVKAYKDETNIYTTLVHGKVAISNTSTTQFLVPNQQSKLDLKNNSITITPIDVYSEVAWKKGLFAFKKMSLNDIMKVLSRWYDVDVEFAKKDLGKVKFNGVLSKNQNLEDILLTIKNTNNINTYEIKNKKVLLK
jgi:transmembrane sensor